MTSAELIEGIQRLDHAGRMEILRFLAAEMPSEYDIAFEGRNHFVFSPRIIADAETITMLQDMRDDAPRDA